MRRTEFPCPDRFIFQHVDRNRLANGRTFRFRGGLARMRGLKPFGLPVQMITEMVMLDLIFGRLNDSGLPLASRVANTQACTLSPHG